MLGSGRFWVGVIVGVGAVWAYHAFVNPLPGKKA